MLADELQPHTMKSKKNMLVPEATAYFLLAYRAGLITWLMMMHHACMPG
jgi:hypothetical protein